MDFQEQSAKLFLTLSELIGSLECFFLNKSGISNRNLSNAMFLTDSKRHFYSFNLFAIIILHSFP